MTTACDEAPEILLRHHVEKLKLPKVLHEHDEIIGQRVAEELDRVRTLARMINLRVEASKFAT